MKKGLKEEREYGMLGNAISVIRKLRNFGYEALFAGGCVRDLILGAPPKDIDIVTNAKPEQVLDLFPNSIRIGEAFGVIGVKEGGFIFEVATFRSDGEYLNGRSPSSVEFNGIEEDAARRDLTINGLYFDPIKEQIIDLVEGEKDLNNKIIRAIGDPHKRFQEDYLRILRVVRFSTQLGFDIENCTYSAAKENVGGIINISKERIKDEIVKIANSPHIERGYSALNSIGIFQALNLPIKKYDLEIKPHPNINVNLANLFLGLQNPKDELKKLRFDNKIVDAVSSILEGVYYLGGDHFWSAKRPDLRRFMGRKDFEHIIYVYQGLKDANKDVLNFLDSYKYTFQEALPEPIYSTQFLFDIGFRGRKLGEKFKELYEYQLLK